jgi:hypothetical protein
MRGGAVRLAIISQRAALAAAVLALVACQGSDALTAPDVAPPPAAAAAPRDLVAPAGLLDALDDAGARVVPVLDDDVRGALGAALGELRVALAAGDAARGVSAVARVRSLVEGRRGEEADADGADLAAVGLLADAAVRNLPGAGSRREGGR